MLVKHLNISKIAITLNIVQFGINLSSIQSYIILYHLSNDWPHHGSSIIIHTITKYYITII